MTHPTAAHRTTSIFPLRFDGEPVSDPMYALPLPPDFRPWEEVVAAYLAARITDLHDSA